MSDIEIVIREAIFEDALAVQKAMSEIAEETDFLTFTKSDMSLPKELMASQLEQISLSDNNLLLLALANEDIIGIASVRGESYPSVAHVGEVGICIYKDYWGMGLGQMMLEEVKAWSEELDVIKRLELKVQVRNESACHLYQKVGFQIEGRSPKAVLSSENEWEDVYVMGLLID